MRTCLSIKFTIEQIAGDLLPNPTPQQFIATGFHRNTPLNLEAGTDPEEDRVKQIVDRVNTTGTVWLGTSIGCAQCHNHKYDPFSTREYYQLLSFFNQTRGGEPAGDERRENDLRRARLRRRRVAEAAQKAKARGGRDRSRSPRNTRMPCRRSGRHSKPIAVKLAALKPAQRELIETPVQDRDLETCEKVHKAVFKGDRALAQDFQKELQRVEKAGAVSAVLRTAVMKEDTMRETSIMQRGDFLSPGVKVRARHAGGAASLSEGRPAQPPRPGALARGFQRTRWSPASR